MILTNTAESRLLDKIAMTEYGLPEAVLMENAGRAVVSRMREFTDWEGAFTVIVCGTGNNGGRRRRQSPCHTHGGSVPHGRVGQDVSEDG